MQIGLYEPDAALCEYLRVALSLQDYRVEVHASTKTVFQSAAAYQLLIVALSLSDRERSEQLLEQLLLVEEAVPILLISTYFSQALQAFVQQFPTMFCLRKPFTF